jgi:dihydrofolate reductase
MTKISLIAAIDEEGGIGSNNQLLAHIPADLKYFKAVTMGKPIIMGRNTYESIGRPLPGRKNIIISSILKSNDQITVLPTITAALEYTKTNLEVMIIGGAQIFAESIKLATCLYITKIHHQFHADVFFPAIDPLYWDCKEISSLTHDEINPYDLSFCIYERR